MRKITKEEANLLRYGITSLKELEQKQARQTPNQQKGKEEKIVVEQEGKEILKVHIPYTQEIWRQKITEIPGRRWSKSRKCWCLPLEKKSMIALRETFGDLLEERLGESTKLIFEDAKEQQKEKSQNNASPPNKTLASKAVKTYNYHGQQRKVSRGEQIIVEAHNDLWLKVSIPKDREGWLKTVKNIRGRKWDEATCHWLVPFDKATLHFLEVNLGTYCKLNVKIPDNLPERLIKDNHKIDKDALGKLGKPIVLGHIDYALNQLENQMRLECLMWHTVKSYRYHFKHFLIYYSNIKAEDITGSQIRKYMLSQLRDKGVSDSTYNQILSALRCYYERALDQEEKTQKLPRPKKRHKFPNVMSRKDVSLILSQIKNLKHRTVVAMMYSCGLRVGEVVRVRLGDLNYETKRLYVKSGKGDKDRYTILPEKMIKMLKEYTTVYRPTDESDWLFKGQYGEYYSIRSVQAVVHNAVTRSGLRRDITAHSFRHAFTTHMHAFGYSVEQLRLWLGHSDISTTQRYLHLGMEDTKASKSPFDAMDL